nr:hypothetical protein [Candidatus Sigynarchaeota archaeon]
MQPCKSPDRAGHFGEWQTDANGMPAFHYTCKEFVEAHARYFTTFGGSRTHYHLLGNTGWFGFATNHGQLYALDPRRGFTMIGTDTTTNHDDGDLGVGEFVFKDKDGKIVAGVNDVAAQPLISRIFGAGYAEKVFKAGDLSITVVNCFPAGGDPAIVAECSMTNESPAERTIEMCSYWNLFHLPMSKSLIVSAGGRKWYATKKSFNTLLRAAVGIQKLFRADTDGSRRRHASKISFRVKETSPSLAILDPSFQGAAKHDPIAPSDINYHYKPVFVACLDDVVDTIRVKKPSFGGTTGTDRLAGLFVPGYEQAKTKSLKNKDACIAMVKKITIPAGTTRSIRFLFGCTEADAISGMIEKYKAQFHGASVKDGAASWFKERSITFNIEGIPWMQNEVAWHGAYMFSSMFKDEYHGYHRVPQGSVYLMGHAFDGSIRDFSLFSYPLMFMDPALAREHIKFIFTCMDEHGKITYALTGFGKRLLVPGIHANPSDQYFFVAWATAEYIYLTRDFAFLDERITLKDNKGKGTSLTIKELLKRLIDYVLSSEVGLGEHGMVRVRDGDWNDGITLMAENRGAFVKEGESTFNSAMLLLSFSKILPVIERFDNDLARRMKDTMDQVSLAIDKAWNSKWYFRGYDGRGNPLGDSTLFLDHHIWMLQNPAMPGDKMDILLKNVRDILMAKSRVGAVIMQPPNPKSSILPPGWDINGGTWHALNSLLAWGLRFRAPVAALDFIAKMSMHNRAEQYPDCWYGQWSAPDAYNADDAERPGEAFFHASTPMCDFPFMNNNLHGGFLAAVIHYAGIEASLEKIRVDVSIDATFSFRSRIIDIEKKPGCITIKPGTHFKEDVMLEIALPESFKDKGTVSCDPASIHVTQARDGVVSVLWSRAHPVSSITIKNEK